MLRHSRGGATITERARLVIGADRRCSLVARAVSAFAYRARPALACAYYAYWNDAPFGKELEVYYPPCPGILAFPALAQVPRLAATRQPGRHRPVHRRHRRHRPGILRARQHPAHHRRRQHDRLTSWAGQQIPNGSAKSRNSRSPWYAASARSKSAGLVLAPSNTVGWLEARLGNTEQGLAHCQQGLALAQEIDNRVIAAAGDRQAARELWQEALEVYEQAHHPATERLHAKMQASPGNAGRRLP